MSTAVRKILEVCLPSWVPDWRSGGVLYPPTDLPYVSQRLRPSLNTYYGAMVDRLTLLLSIDGIEFGCVSMATSTVLDPEKPPSMLDPIALFWSRITTCSMSGSDDYVDVGVSLMRSIKTLTNNNTVFSVKNIVSTKSLTQTQTSPKFRSRHPCFSVIVASVIDGSVPALP